jgi:hypothetical protein
MLGVERGVGVAGGDGGAEEEEEEEASAAPGIAHTAAPHALFSRGRGGGGRRRGECLCALTEEGGVHAGGEVSGLLRAGVVQGLLAAVLHVFERVRQVLSLLALLVQKDKILTDGERMCLNACGSVRRAR